MEDIVSNVDNNSSDTEYNTTDSDSSPYLDCNVEDLTVINFYLLIPAVLIVIIYMFMETRKNLFPNCLRGHFAIVVPFNLIENKNNRLPYVAVFTLISLSSMNVLNKDASELTGINATNHFEIVLLKQLYILIICIIYLPIFASCSTKNLVNLLLGISYSIVFMAVFTYEIFTKLSDNSCDWKKLPVPSATALILYLIITYTSEASFLFCQLKRISFSISSCKEDKNISLKEIEETDHARLYTKHLFSLSRKKIQEPLTERKKGLRKAIRKLHLNIPGFRYSLSIFASISLGMSVIFYYASVFAISGFSTWMESRKWIKKNYADAGNTTTDNIILRGFNFLFLQGKGEIDNSIQIPVANFLMDQLSIIYLSYVIAIILSFVSIFIISLHMLKTYRIDMLNLYKSESVAMELQSSNHVKLVVSANKFVGYQVAYFFWGFILQSAVLWVILILIGEIIIFPLAYGMWGFLKGFFYRYGPTIIMMWVVYFIQYLLIKYLFVQDRGKYLALDNRRGFMNLMYFFLFYNMFIGLFSCFKRIFKSMVFGLLFIPRLDRSIMPKTFQKYDPGFKSYVCLMKLEAMQTNPVLTAFLSVLYEEAKRQSIFRRTSMNSRTTLVFSEDTTDIQQADRKKKVARNRWFLACTLIFNPSLQVDRWTEERLQSRLAIVVVPRNNELSLNSDEIF